MANPFRAAMGGSQAPQGGPVNMMQAFQQFKQNFQGDPKTEVQKLLASGRINQGQLNQLQVMAKQFQSMLGQ